MTKFFILTGLCAFVVFTGSSASASSSASTTSSASGKDDCVPVDFTTEASEFSDLNDAIALVKSASVLGFLLDDYDPLVLRNTTLSSINYSILGQDVKITPTVHAVKITGLSTVVPENVNVTSPNSVDISGHSNRKVSVDASLTVATNVLGTSAKAKVKFTMVKPKFKANVEANMNACAPSVDTSLCSNMTVAGLQVEVLKAAVFGSYKTVLKKVLMKFKDASVKSVSLDFASVSEFDVTFDSSSLVLSSISGLLSDFSVKSINERGTIYNKVISTINTQGPALLNKLIESKLKSLFCATWLSEDN